MHIPRIIDSNPFSTSIQRRQQFYGKVYYHTLMDCKELQPPQSQPSQSNHSLRSTTSTSFITKTDDNRSEVNPIYHDNNKSSDCGASSQPPHQSPPITSALPIEPFDLFACIKKLAYSKGYSTISLITYYYI